MDQQAGSGRFDALELRRQQFFTQSRHWLLTGGSGFLGQALVHRLLDAEQQVSVWSRNPAGTERLFGGRVSVFRTLDDLPDTVPLHGIINLAGAPIAGGRWSPARQQLLRDSRIALTDTLLAWLSRRAQRPEVLLSGSAIGFYGVHGDEELDEQQPGQDIFMSTLCQDWERSAEKATRLGVRLALLRTGLVLGNAGGALPAMLKPFRFGIGGRTGSGRQWLSWIHLEDWLGIVETLLATPEASGPYNLTAPEPVINAEFARTAGQVMGRPAWLPLPAWPLKLALGEMADLLLTGQRVLPRRMQSMGYRFRYPALRAALEHLLRDQEPPQP